MATKTISLRLEAYERLKAARSFPGESFSQVVLRARWPERAITGRELLQSLHSEGAHFTAEELSLVEESKRTATPDRDKWAES